MYYRINVYILTHHPTNLKKSFHRKTSYLSKIKTIKFPVKREGSVLYRFPTAQEPIKMLYFRGRTAEKHLLYNNY